MVVFFFCSTRSVKYLFFKWLEKKTAAHFLKFIHFFYLKLQSLWKARSQSWLCLCMHACEGGGDVIFHLMFWCPVLAMKGFVDFYWMKRHFHNHFSILWNPYANAFIFYVTTECFIVGTNFLQLINIYTALWKVHRP